MRRMFSRLSRTTADQVVLALVLVWAAAAGGVGAVVLVATLAGLVALIWRASGAFARHVFRPDDD